MGDIISLMDFIESIRLMVVHRTKFNATKLCEAHCVGHRKLQKMENVFRPITQFLCN